MRAHKKTSGTGRWWSRTRGLDRAVYDAYVESLGPEAPRPQILAWANAEEGVCIGSRAVISYGGLDTWTHVGWHEIENGGWNVENHALSWTLYGGHRGRVVLTEPGRLPELFRERVAASIVLKKFVPVDGTRGVTIAGRRDLGESDPVISWHSTLGRGLTWQTEGAREVTEAALAQVKVEYDMG